MSKKERKKLKSQNPPQNMPMPRMIQLQDIPRDLQPLAVKITRLENAIMTTRNALAMNFDYIIDLLVDLKKESMNLIQQTKTLEKARSEEHGEKKPEDKKG